jgi:hypothetical protein
VDQNTYWIYRRFLYSYGYYFSSISVDPSNAKFIYQSAVIKSDDGGKTFKSISEENVHSDHHIVWVNQINLGI